MEKIMNILMVSIALGAPSAFGMGSAPNPSQPGFYSYNQHLNQAAAPYGYYPAQVVPDNQHQPATVNQYGYQGGQDAHYQELSSSTPYKSSPFEEFLFNDDDQANDSEAVSSVAQQFHEALNWSEIAEKEDDNELIVKILNQPETNMHDQNNNGGNAQLRTSDEHFREFFGDDALAPEEEEEFERAYSTQILYSDWQPTVTPTSIHQADYDKALFAAIQHHGGGVKKVANALGTPENPKGNPYAVNSYIKTYKNMTVLMAALKKGNIHLVKYLIDHYPDHDWQADDGVGHTVEQLARLFKEEHTTSAAQTVANNIIGKCQSCKQEVLPKPLSGVLNCSEVAVDPASYDKELFIAIKSKDIKRVEGALGTPENRKGNPYAVSRHTKNYTNMTVLMAALKRGDTKIVTYLVDHYPDHDWQADDGAGCTVEQLARLFKEKHRTSAAQIVADYIIGKCQ